MKTQTKNIKIRPSAKYVVNEEVNYSGRILRA